MAYVRQSAQAGLDVDGLRRFTEAELTRIARVTAELDTSLSSITTDIAANTASIAVNAAAIAKLTNNQFAKVSLSANQTGLASATYTKVNFATIDFDASSIWDNTNKQFKPTIAGYYAVQWCATLQVAGGTFVYLADLHKNNTRHARGSSVVSTGTSIQALCGGSTLIHMNGTTDVVDIRAYIEGTASRDVIGDPASTQFAIFMVKAD